MQTVQSLIFLALLIGIFYFMLVRPQKRRVQQHNDLLQSIGVGDDIVTIGGLHGTVRSIGDDDVEIEAAPGVTMRFVKNAIARRVTEELEDNDTPSIAAASDSTDDTAAETEDAEDSTAETASTTADAEASATTEPAKAEDETVVLETSEEEKS